MLQAYSADSTHWDKPLRATPHAQARSEVASDEQRAEYLSAEASR